MYVVDSKVYTIEDMQSYLQLLDSYTVHSKYLDVPCAFDIEVSSWLENKEKRAAMYVWQFGIDGHIILGRTWKEFTTLLKEINKTLNLSEDRKLVVYVHNLSYEFQFLKSILKFVDVFYTDDRKPLKAITADFIEFRCSYRLSGKGLSKTAEELVKYPAKKLEGELDYDLIRHSKTPLTEQEIAYCVNDVLVVMNYIQEKIEQEGCLNKIPLTITGYVRRFCKKKCFGEKYQNTKKYNQFIRRMVLTQEEYDMCKEAFMGGYVHCSFWWKNQLVINVDCYDFCSSYPAVMVSFNRFPMTAPTHRGRVSIEQYEQYMEKYACLATITFYDLELKESVYFPPISESKCSVLEGCKDLDNGRVVNASKLTTTITEQDYLTYRDCYNWSSVTVDNLLTFGTGYLPSSFVDGILELYEQKTKLKGVEGMETEYLLYKGMLNSCYGMCVTDISKQFDNLEDYNNKLSRFLYYPWGVWVSAVSRRRLYTGILECGEDLVYCDTDSLKTLNGEAHKAYIDNYNKDIEQQLIKAMNYHGFDINRLYPKDIEGNVHLLGVWDYEGKCEEFKGVRAKAYIAKKNGKCKLTLSGVNSKEGIKYLEQKGNPVEVFNQTLCFPAEYTGKKTLTYIDEKHSGVVYDYLGNKGKYNEKSSIHMAACEFDMNEETDYIHFLEWLFTGKRRR